MTTRQTTDGQRVLGIPRVRTDRRPMMPGNGRPEAGVTPEPVLRTRRTRTTMLQAGEPRLGILILGVNGDRNDVSEVDSMLPAGLPPSPSLPWLEQLPWGVGTAAGPGRPRVGMASPSSSNWVASISCSVRPARYIWTRIHFFFLLQITHNQ